MEDEGNVKITDTNTLEKLRTFDSYFHLQLDLLKELANRTYNNKNLTRIGQIFPVLIGLKTSGVSLCFLLRNELMTEAFMIARAFMERIVNACYLVICERSLFEDYIHFSMQKVQRSLQSKQKAHESIGHIIPVPDYSRVPAVAEGLKKFTSHRGREITRWTKLRLDKRIEAIGDKVEHFSVPLFLSFYNYLYEDASEAIHGTLYGCIFHTGFPNILPDMKESDEYVTSMKITFYMLNGLLIEGLLYTVLTEMDVRDLIEQSEKNRDIFISYFDKNKKQPTS